MLLPESVLYSILNKAANARRSTAEVLDELSADGLEQLMTTAGKLEVLPLPPSRGTSTKNES